MARELSFVQSVERSISKTYRERLWTPFITAIKNYKLIEEGDKIAVCISGGKDSMLMAKLIQMLHRHSDVKFNVEYLVMDPGYNEINRQKIESNAKLLEIPITVFETNIFDVANNTERSPCYVCAKMRRGHLYHKAKDLGCNKIALGHHLSDVIETTVMAMFYGSQLQGMMPKLHSLNFGGMELHPPHVLHQRARHYQLEKLQRAAVYPVRLPLYRKLHRLRQRRWRQQAPRNQGSHQAPQARKPEHRKEHLQQPALRLHRDVPRLQGRRRTAFVLGRLRRTPTAERVNEPYF